MLKLKLQSLEHPAPDSVDVNSESNLPLQYTCIQDFIL